MEPQTLLVMSRVTLRTARKGETPPIMQMPSETFSTFSDTKMRGKCVPFHSWNVIDWILSLSCSVLSHDFLSYSYWNSKSFYSLSGYARSGSLLPISLIRSLKKTDLRFFYIDLLIIICLPTRMEVLWGARTTSCSVLYCQCPKYCPLDIQYILGKHLFMNNLISVGTTKIYF